MASSMETTALSRLTGSCDLDVDYCPVDADEEKLMLFLFCFSRRGCGCIKWRGKNNCIHPFSVGHVQEVKGHNVSNK